MQMSCGHLSNRKSSHQTSFPIWTGMTEAKMEIKVLGTDGVSGEQSELFAGKKDVKIF